MKSREVVWHTLGVISTPYLHRRHMAPIYGRMIILLRIFKKYQSKKYFALIHPIRFFSIEKLEKEENWFHMDLKTEWIEFECFIENVVPRHYINEFIRVINWNNLNETFQGYRKNYSIVTKKFFSLWLWLFR